MIGFSDETYIDIASGNGGHGAVSFHREKFVPKGGPDGGDGGKGGDVIFVIKDNLRTLSHLKRTRTYRAENGGNGSGNNCTGKDGANVYISVPNGTILKNANTGKVIKDLTNLKEFVFLKGGRGGKGNSHFKTSRFQTPRFAQDGEMGTEIRVGVELKLIADVGLVGFPNAGKSSLINAITNATSEVSPYPFTTKIPHLGMLRLYGEDVLIADIPGLLEGSSEGRGMGIKFLKHIERTHSLAFLIDMSDENALDAFEILLHELNEYSHHLGDKNRIIICTKMDIDGTKDTFKAMKKKFKNEKLYPLSVYNKDMLSEVEKAFLELRNSSEEKINSIKQQEKREKETFKSLNIPEGTVFRDEV